MRAVWQGSENFKWSWLENGMQAYWSLCLECHRKAWPEDRRSNNRQSKPMKAVVAGGNCWPGWFVGGWFVGLRAAHF